MKRMCKQCSGSGRQDTHGLYRPSTIDCLGCDGAGFVVEWEEATGMCLANSDLDSQPVCVSNLRVWAEAHADTEGTLWRMRHGGYGSQWVELRAGILAIYKGGARYERAERLGLTGLTAIINDLERLSNTPFLDEDDVCEAEQEEQAEHWESYGRSDMERAIRKASEDAEGTEDETVCNWLDDTSSEYFDKLYWQTCHDAAWYPERIDSSAWDFGGEPRWGRPAPIVGPMLAAIRPSRRSAP